MACDEDQYFFNLTLSVAQCSINEELQEWFMISWAVWDARNRYVFDNTQLQPTTILSTTLKYLEDFKKVAKLGAFGFLSIAQVSYQRILSIDVTYLFLFMFRAPLGLSSGFAHSSLLPLFYIVNEFSTDFPQKKSISIQYT